MGMSERGVGHGGRHGDQWRRGSRIPGADEFGWGRWKLSRCSAGCRLDLPGRHMDIAVWNFDERIADSVALRTGIFIVAAATSRANRRPAERRSRRGVRHRDDGMRHAESSGRTARPHRPMRKWGLADRRITAR